MSTQNSSDVVVVGGGMAGLAAASYIARAGRTVTVMERRNRLGGQATTDERDGFLFNQGPHALYRGGSAQSVLGELGVQIEGGQPPTKTALLVDGRVEIGPSGPMSLLRSRALSVRAKLELARLLASLPRIDATALGNVSAAEWLDARLAQEQSLGLVHALFRLATYVNDPEQMSADVAVSQLQLALSDGVTYVDRGWQSLVGQLEAGLEAHPNATIERGGAVDELPDAPVVIIAGGGPAAAEALVGRQFDVGPAATASCLDLGLSKRPAHDLALGVGIPFYFSNHSAAADLAPTDSFAASAVQYLGQHDEPDTDWIAAQVELVGVETGSILARRRLHRMTTVTAIASVEHGGMAGRPGVDASGLDHVFLAGDWVGPTGHLLDASLASARDAGAMALRSLEQRPRSAAV